MDTASPVLANDEHVVVLLTVRASIAGRDLADQAVHVCHVRDGAISEVWAAQWTPNAFDEAVVEGVELVVSGCTNRQIASRLKISPRTAEHLISLL